MAPRSTTGPTPGAHFRLPAETLAALDAVVAHLTAERGHAQSRTDALKHLIHDAEKKLRKKSEKAAHSG